MYKVVSLKYIPGVNQGENAIKAAGGELVRRLCKTGPESSEDEILDAVRDADVAITMLQPFSRRVMENASKLRAICVTGTGYDWIDVPSATDLGICITNVPDYCLEEVANHAMMLLLACARKLFPLHHAIKKGFWDAPLPVTIRQEVMPPMFRISKQTLGLVGFGNISRTITPRAKAFGLRVITYDPYIKKEIANEFNVEMVELDQLLKESDFVSLHASLTDENRNLIGRRELALMKSTAYLINTARGPLVDETALYEALNEGRIAGAGLDVLEVEPPSKDNPLFALENIIITPHTAQYSQQAEEEGWRYPGEEAARILNAQWPRSIAFVNPAVKEKYVERWGKMRNSDL